MADRMPGARLLQRRKTDCCGQRGAVTNLQRSTQTTGATSPLRECSPRTIRVGWPTDHVRRLRKPISGLGPSAGKSHEQSASSPERDQVAGPFLLLEIA